MGLPVTRVTLLGNLLISLLIRLRLLITLRNRLVNRLLHGLIRLYGNIYRCGLDALHGGS